MTSPLRELLTSWRMPDSVIQIFEEEEFDEYSLLTLSKDKINELIVKQGPRCQFEFELEKLKRKNLQYSSQSPNKKTKQITDHSINIRKENQTPNVLINASSSNILPSSSNTLIFPEEKTDTIENATGVDLLDNPIICIGSTQESILEISSAASYNLLEVLSKSSDGQCGLAYYNQHKKLDDAHRNKIARCVISDIILHDPNKKLAKSVAEYVTNEIIKQFPSEELFKNIWYDKSGGTNSGKLFVQYHSIRRKLRSSGVISSQKKNNQSLLSEKEDDAVLIRWLENNSQPWSEVEEKWTVTYASRFNHLLTSQDSVGTYLSQFIALKSDLGYSLLELDFNLTYPNASLNLYNEWTHLSQFIVHKLKEKNIELNVTDLAENGKAILILLNLHKLFPIITVYSHNKLSWRPSAEEMKDSFLLHVNTYNDIETSLAKRRALLLKYKLPLQPVPIIVGTSINSITEHYIAIDNTYYAVESVIKAIDITFKSFHALHARYSIECEQIWLFLQLCIYGIRTRWDKPKVGVKTLISAYEIFLRDL